MSILLTSGVSGYTQVQYSTDNLTFFNATLTNENKVILEELDNGINENQIYYFRIRHVYSDGTSNWSYITSFSDTSGELPMSSMAVLGFMTLFTMGIFFLPTFVKRFTKYEFADTAIRGSLFVMGIFLIMLDTVVAYSYSIHFNLGVDKPLYFIMWFVGWCGVIGAGILILSFGRRTLEQLKEHRTNRRYRYDE